MKYLGLTLTAVMILTACSKTSEGSQQTVSNITAMESDLEIRLARSALPEHLQASATVYVLDPAKGYKVAVEGTNGFHTFVARNDLNVIYGTWEYKEYRSDVIIPIAFDSAGAKVLLQPWFEMAELMAQGVKPSDLRTTILERFSDGTYTAPERVGVSYMISPVFRPYLAPQDNDQVVTFSMPHYMFYAPHLTNADIGGEVLSKHPWIPTPGLHGFIIIPMGDREREARVKEYDSLIKDLCSLKAEYCLPAGLHGGHEH